MSESAQPQFPADVEAEDLNEDLDADLDADLNEEEELDDNGDENDAAAGSGAARPSRASNSRLIRRVAAKAAEVDKAPASVRDVAAHLLGSGSDLGELTAAIMLAGRSSTQVLADLDKIAGADIFEASVVAGELGTARMKRIWSLLSSMALAPGGDLPSSSGKASIKVARTVHELDMDDVRKDLEDVIVLLKRA